MALRRGPLLFVIALLVCLAALGALVAYVKLGPASDDIPDYALTLQAEDEHPSADDMQRARQVLLHRLRIAHFDSARVEKSGERRLVMHARGEGMDALRGLAGRGQLRMRTVLANTPGTNDVDEDAVPEVGDTARPAVADRLGDAYTAAAKATSFKEGRKLPKAVQDAFKALSAKEVATLPLRMQMIVPTITCDRLRPGDGDGDPARAGVVCADDDETKYLVDRTDILSADITECTLVTGPQGLSMLLKLTRDAQPRLTALTRVLAPEHRKLAVVIDGLLVEAPTVQAEIPDDIELTVGSSLYVARSLCARLGGGELPMAFTEIA